MLKFAHIAKGIQHEAVKGYYSQLNKEHLLVGLCTALGIDHRVHYVAHGIDKTKIKWQIKKLKKERDELLAAGADKDRKKLISTFPILLNDPVNLPWAVLNGLIVLPAPRGQASFVFGVFLVSVIISFFSLM